MMEQDIFGDDAILFQAGRLARTPSPKSLPKSERFQNESLRVATLISS
jgi:hypothetical protein